MSAGDELDRILADRSPRWPWVVIVLSLVYMAIRIAPWALAGFPTAR